MKKVVKKMEIEGLAVLIEQNSKDLKNLTGIVGQNSKDLKNLTGIVGQNSKDLKNLTGIVGQNSKDLKNLADLVGQNIKDIDSLAIMTKRGFDEVHEKFNDMDNKMATKEDLRDLENRLDDKIEGLGMRFGSYISDCELNFDELDIRVSKIEDKMAKVK